MSTDNSEKIGNSNVSSFGKRRVEMRMKSNFTWSNYFNLLYYSSYKSSQAYT